jgi:NAD(P)H-nitrite reductase large subunit
MPKKLDNRIVCDCKQITAAQIHDAVDNGACKYYDVQSKTGAGRTCGSCAPDVIKILAKRFPDARSF